jgi:WD40 repeat protein
MQTFQFRPRHPVHKVAFLPDGSGFITAQPFVGAAIRNSLTGEASNQMRLDDQPRITTLRVSPDGIWCQVNRLLVRLDGTDNERFYQEVVGFTPQGPRAAFNSHSGEFGVMTFSANSEWPWDFKHVGKRGSSTIVTTSPDGLFGFGLRTRGRPFLFDLDRECVLVEFDSKLRWNHPLEARGIEFSPFNNRVALSEGTTLAVFDLNQIDRDRKIDSTEKPKPQILAPIFTLPRPDPSILGTAADKALLHWAPPVAFAPDGRTLLVLGLRNRVQQWEIESGRLQREWGWRTDPIFSLAISWDGLSAMAGCRMGRVVLWDLE